MMEPADPGDLDTLDTIFESGFADYARSMGQSFSGRRVWLAAALSGGSVWWLADRRGAVVMSRSGTTLTIDSLAFAPAHQRAGLGRRALDAIEAHARHSGATEIALHTAQQFTHLVAFYSKSGYRVVRVGPHPKGRDDRLRVFMMKSLV